MFPKLGKIVCKTWPVILVAWIGLLVFLVSVAPPWKDVVQDGEFAFLPEDVPSRIGEAAFKRAFPDDAKASTIAIVLLRESGDGLERGDLEFITKELVPALKKIALQDGGLASMDDDEVSSAEAADEAENTGPSDRSKDASPKRSIISRIRTFDDSGIGDLLQSDDKKATLVYVELTTELLEYGNSATIKKVESLIARDGKLRQAHKIPPGLAISISGSATVGRDMRRAQAQSASATETWTIALVLGLLILIYRAPLLAVIPLVTVGLATTISIKILSLLAQVGLVTLFDGIEVYVTVLVYGAGVDYCLFLIARYKEELDSSATYNEAIANSLGKVGAALTASAGTVMCGIGMMIFAEFGKFRQAGVAITFSLFICLCAALTFTPALLRLSGRWAFWPKVPTERLTGNGGWISATSLMARLMRQNWLNDFWRRVARTLLAWPGRIWIGSILLMLPFAVIAVMFFSYLSYGLLAELPQDEASVVGAKAIQSHFPAGYVDPIKILLINENEDFTKARGGIKLIDELTKNILERKDQLGIADVRSVSHPQGGDKGLDTLSVLRRRVAQIRSVRHYVCDDDSAWNKHATRLEIVFNDDPFSRNSIAQITHLEQEFPNLLPEQLQADTQLHFVGASASINDLKHVTDRDQLRIDVLVLTGVFAILVILLRRPSISAYLVLTVFFSYLATLGVTFVVYWSMDPANFTGLDWKVPMFLFTILIAVGEDYNIFLMTRIEEEQIKHGPIVGVTVALERTGGIISSCGVIMAGTFSSLLAGSLVGMQQLGFALAFGVLLDTFVVRPIMVPSYLILLHSGRFGRLGRWLGARTTAV